MPNIKIMARKSKLTPSQWEEILKRHLVDGESVNSLAKEFVIDEKSIRNYLNKSTSCKDEKDSIPNKSESKSEAIQNTAVELIEHARSRLGNESDARVAISLAEQTISVRSRLTQVANNTLEVALEISEFARKHKGKIFQGDSIDIEALKQSVFLAKSINEYSYLGNEVSKANKPKEDENKEDRQITFVGGLPELPK